MEYKGGLNTIKEDIYKKVTNDTLIKLENKRYLYKIDKANEKNHYYLFKSVTKDFKNKVRYLPNGESIAKSRVWDCFIENDWEIIHYYLVISDKPLKNKQELKDLSKINIQIK